MKKILKNAFLGFHARVNSGQLQGFLVVKDLELCRAACNPHMGFAIQRTVIQYFIGLKGE